MSQKSNHRRRSCLIFLAFVPLFSCFSGQNGFAQVAPTSHIWKRLGEPLTTSVEGVEVRRVAKQICDQKKINFWFDTRCNPSSPVTLSAVQRPIWESLENIANQVGLVVLVIDNIAVMTQPRWMESFSEWPSWRQQNGNRITVNWPTLTTPAGAIDAIGEVTLNPGSSEVPRLRHDLLPETRWVDVAPSIANRLIATTNRLPSAEQDRNFESTQDFDRLVVEFPYTILADKSVTGLKITRRRGDIHWFRGRLNAHRDWMRQCVEKESAKRLSPDAEPLEVLYSLNVGSTAGELLSSLAAAAKRKLDLTHLDPARLEQRIEFKVKNESLRTLLQRVATELSAEIEFTNNKVILRDLD